MSQASTLLALMLALIGCATMVPATEAEKQSGFTYIPIDPFAVEIASPLNGKRLLDLLPDNAVRTSVQSFDTSGNVTYGPASLRGESGLYRVTLDYVTSDTVPVTIWMSKVVNNELTPVIGITSRKEAEDDRASEVDSGSYYIVTRAKPGEADLFGYSEVSIPVYVGVGLRITAEVFTSTAGTEVSGIGVLGMAADANRLQGTMVTQTIGINGRAVAAALPIQSELNRTTTQNAVVAIGSIKTLLFNDSGPDATVKCPRVTGMYLPFEASEALINAIVSELAKVPVIWNPRCLNKAPVK